MKPSILLTLTATAASTSAFTLPFKFRRDTVSTEASNTTPNHRLLHSPPTNVVGNARGRIKAASTINNRPSFLRAGSYVPYHPPAATPDHPNQNQDMIQSVTGSLIIPTISMPVSGPTAGNSVGEYSASLWVGIDGASATDSFTHPIANATCNPLAASLRAGVDIFWDGTLGGQQTPYVWAQWYPAEHARGFLDFKASPGDELRFTVTTGPHGNSGGGVLVENYGPPQSPKGVDGKVKIPIATGSLIWKDMPPLCSAQASWILEDFPLQERPELPSALGNFTDVRFSEMGFATWLGGNFTGEDVLGKDKLKLLEIYDAGQGGTLARCKTDGEGEKKSVICSRVVEA
ncbi:concanavalin A-like lectin/glucanase [Neurospora crassa]|uniref:Acid proteinase n=2 Tax=Neurospora crassa TaxID=5141 RepID=Q1K7D2_NEUCR|nr:acid proteinase [Neurospora crassa OR74A]EAA31929.1 acid proteinase [Neurospora crassa OR74A]KHE86055.1 concanavalin A-like lectin/glucanase [Neurospora crassa]CAD36982.1 related to acid proteinase [Neurospora crassa]|eukprot:XP_961165.1 acid proteinase [Neurospora crassa OR74A]